MNRHLNLLPWAVQRRLMLGHRVRQWAWAYAAAAFVFSGFYLRECYLLSRCRAALGSWQNRAAAIQGVEDGLDQSRQQLGRFKKQFAAYGHLESDQCGYQLLATVSRGITNCPDHIQVQNLGFVRKSITETPVPDKSASASTAPPQPITRESRVLQLRGVAANHLAISRFVSSLRDCAAFQKVELRSTQTKGTKHDDVRGFQVECTF